MATWAPKKGQTVQQAQNDANNSPVYRQSTGFATGRANSQQSPYSGSTPYQKNPAGDFAAYSPSSNTTRTQTSKQGSSPFSQAPQMPASQMDGNWANYASPQRPGPFQATYGSPMGGQSDQPNFAQRDAFIQNINNQMTPYMTGQASGAPQFNLNQAWSSAGQMVNDGWQNPFAAVSQQSFPSQYQAASRAPGTATRAGQDIGMRRAPGVQGFPDPPPRSQMVAGMAQSSGGTQWGLGSGQGGPNPGAVGYYDGPAQRKLSPPPPLSPDSRPLNPQARKSWDARYAAQNKAGNSQKSHYDLNKDGAYKGMTEEEAMRSKFASDSSGSAYNSDPAYRAMVDEKRRERMTPTMWASMQGEIVENGVRRKSGFMKNSDIAEQTQWLAARGLTGIPDGTTLDENRIYEDYLASQGKSIDSLMADRASETAERRAARNAAPPSYAEQQAAERARRAQSQEDVIRQFQQERGVDPRELMRNRGRPPGRTPIYI